MDLLITELLLTLGVQPLAIANVPLYNRLVSEPSLSPETVDLGPLQEPNLEFLQLLRPDLIVMADWQASGLENLKRLASIQTISTFAGTVPAVEHMQAQLRILAKLAGRVEAAEATIAHCNAELAAASESFSRRSTPPLYLCRFNQNARQVAIFGGNGLVGDVMARLGLRNAWTGRVNASGVASIGIEQLAGNPDARIVHFDRGRETEIAMARLADSPLWRALPAVRHGRVNRMPVIYPSGGVVSATRLAQQLVASLAGAG
ncbi:ABC transporter substrate-binding protein [Rhizobium sp. SSA_523]|uniref:ABC transporter substrate-binding protein n=1 Tax=Rhizobium sp. SSA_523 TaxID=2952477 RepID=UPI002090E6D2|nr:ABC transporter substrate-binding protein [Rhizobium sp. SSA_523]MCO5731246.1 ABC transporter substrate-binding protein [Rhizobium sp. SSA_523]WKC22216.1 ABC transporter substrate-binding protein [Rhizobium sp. SSA_523]